MKRITITRFIKLMKCLIISILFTINVFVNAQDNRFISVKCSDTGNNEMFEVSFSRTVPLTPVSNGMKVQVNAVNRGVKDYQVIFTNLSSELASSSPSKEFIFIPNRATRFRNDLNAQLILQPNYTSSETRGQCNRLQIDIPVLNNKKPTSSIPDYSTSIAVIGNPVARQINGKDLIDDDDYSGGNWRFDSHDNGITVDPVTGVIDFSHRGRLVNGADETFNAVVVYTDWDNYAARSKIRINVSAGAVAPTLSSQVLSERYYEGFQKAFGTIRAMDPVSNSFKPVELVGTLSPTMTVQPDIYGATINSTYQLVWSPPHSIVSGTNESRQVVFVMKPVDDNGPEMTTKNLTVTVYNTPDNPTRNDLEEAWRKYEEANALFMEKIRRPSCILAHSVSFLENNDYTLTTISNAYNSISNLAVNIPSQVIPFIDLALSISQNFNNSKRNRFNSIASKWKSRIEPLANTSSGLRQELLERKSNDYKDNFTTRERSKALLLAADNYLTNVNNLTDAIFEVEATINLVSNNRRNQIRTMCP